MTFAEKMDQYLDKYCELYKLSGIFRVTHKDEIIYQRCIGYADIEHKVPFDNSTVFTLYSMSKPFCVFAIMTLVDKGLISIHDHPGKYLPEVAGADSRITIRHLMNHTSGLRDFNQERAYEATFVNAYRPNLRAHVAHMVKLPLNFEPGTATRYTNINFTILALIVENVSGMAYRDYMLQNVFTPMGLKHAQVDQLELLADHRARGYDIDGDNFIPADRLNPNSFLGAGDIIADIEDVYCLNTAMKHQKLLSPERWAEILTPSDVGVFGLGCQVWDWHGKKRIQHNGGSRGFRTLHVWLPEDDLDIILLSNTGFGDARWSLTNAVYTAFYGDETVEAEATNMDFIESVRILPEGFLPRRKPAITLTAEQEARILGTYSYSNGDPDSYLTKREDGTYCIHSQGWQKLYCYPVSETVLASCNLDEAHKLEFTEDGRVLLDGMTKIG